MPVSVVIIAKNEAHCIHQCVSSALQLTDDVIVVDTGSSDHTAAIAQAAGARVIHHNWLGYGATRNAGAQHARNNWIVSLDADETIPPALVQEIQAQSFTTPAVVYQLKRQNFFLDKPIRFGAWKNDKVLRLYNQTHTSWNNEAVHEDIQLPGGTTVTQLQQPLHHYTVKDLYSFTAKNLHYAQLSALRYAAAGKKASGFKLWFSPLFGFIKGYIFQLGFLDGREGFYIAKVNAFYTFMKYALLKKQQ